MFPTIIDGHPLNIEACQSGSVQQQEWQALLAGFDEYELVAS
jgi:hypothetical protein